MAFPLSEEQVEFQETLRGFFAENFSGEKRRKWAESADSECPELLTQLESLGIRESFASEDPDERPPCGTLAIIAQECGRALVPGGFWESLLGGPVLWQRVLDHTMREKFGLAFGDDIGARLLSGECRTTIAVQSGILGAAPSDKTPSSRARKPKSLTPSELTHIHIVPWVHGSQLVLLCDPTSQKVGALLSDGASKSPIPLIDLTVRAATLSCERATIAECSPESAGLILRMAQLLRAAEISGCITQAIDMTTEYAKTREQFGVPIGGFQAVQQRLADMYLKSESIGALVRFAAWSADASPEQFGMSALAALQRALAEGPRIIEGAIQLHGGIGFTYEYDLHLYLRRVRCLEAQWRLGDAESAQLIEAALAQD